MLEAFFNCWITGQWCFYAILIAFKVCIMHIHMHLLSIDQWRLEEDVAYCSPILHSCCGIHCSICGVSFDLHTWYKLQVACMYILPRLV